MKRVLLILADNRGISTFPAVYQTAMELKKRNCHITIVTGSECDDRELYKFFDKYVLEDNRIVLRYGMQLLPFCNPFSKFLLINKFDLVIAYEPRDAILIALSTLLKRQPKYVYYNLEIAERKNEPISSIEIIKRFKHTVLKWLEKQYLNNCDCMVIQDDIRRDNSKKHGIFHQNTFLIANSYYSNFDISERQYGGNKTKMSILYSGSLERWSISEIISQLNKLGENIITLSGWSRDGYLNEIMDYLVSIPNIKLCNNTLSIKEYIALVKQNDIGLVWYSTNVDNVYFIGRSSGKLFMYLSCGKPVIVQDLSGIAEDVRLYKLGVVISSLDELPDAIQTIKNNYIEFVENVKNTYLKLFDYSIISQEFFDYLMD